MRELARRTAPGGDSSQTVERLTESLAQAKRDSQQAREKARRQIDELKAENTQLRRTLGQTRTDLKQARAETDDRARTVASEARQAADASVRAAEAEVRRLRARVSELESDNSAARRAIRDDRDAEVMRLRLLLETMTEAAAGCGASWPCRRRTCCRPTRSLRSSRLSADSGWGAGRALLDDDPGLVEAAARPAAGSPDRRRLQRLQGRVAEPSARPAAGPARPRSQRY